jgi:hypothetical protein
MIRHEVSGMTKFLTEKLWPAYCYCFGEMIITQDSVHFMDPPPPKWPWDNDPPRAPDRPAYS